MTKSKNCKLCRNEARGEGGRGKDIGIESLNFLPTDRLLTIVNGKQTSGLEA